MGSKNLQWSINFSVGNQLCKSRSTESLSFILVSFPFPLNQESVTGNVHRAILTSFMLKRKHRELQWLRAPMAGSLKVGSHTGWEPHWLGAARLGATMVGSCNCWEPQCLRAIMAGSRKVRSHDGWEPQWLGAAMAGSHNGWELQWLGATMVGSHNGWERQWLEARFQTNNWTKFHQ